MEKISIKEKICYGLGDSSANIFLGMTMMFLPYFYTDIVGISAGAMGTLFIIARLFDAFYDPIIGNIADNTKSKHGHYRPYLLYLAVPYGLSCFLVFLAPDLSPMGKLIYAYVTYLFLILMYASTVVPYVGLLAAITNDPAERLSINSYRFPLAKMSFLICSALVPMFVSMYDKAHEAQAYQGAMAIISILATVFLLICFWGTKERNMTSSVKADKISKEPLINQLKLMFKTGPIVYYYLAHMTGIVAFTLQGSVAIYFVKYYLNQGGNFVSGLLSAMAVAGILGPFIAIFLIQKGFLNKLKLLKLSAVGMGTVALCLFFIPADYLWLAVSALVLSTLFNGVGSIVTWALPADCADYCEVHHNKKMSGVIGAGALFAMKFGMSIAGGLVGWILSMVGYQANAAITPNISLAILVLISVFPAVFKYASYFFLRLYSLDDIETEKIKQELQQRYASS